MRFVTSGYKGSLVVNLKYARERASMVSSSVFYLKSCMLLRHTEVYSFDTEIVPRIRSTVGHLYCSVWVLCYKIYFITFWRFGLIRCTLERMSISILSKFFFGSRLLQGSVKIFWFILVCGKIWQILIKVLTCFVKLFPSVKAALSVMVLVFYDRDFFLHEG